MSQVAYGVVFAIADSDLPNGTLGARAATITSLLMLGVPETRAIALVGDQPCKSPANRISDVAT
jgi:hypothetical protein